jgi:hypothetical protein
MLLDPNSVGAIRTSCVHLPCRSRPSLVTTGLVARAIGPFVDVLVMVILKAAAQSICACDFTAEFDPGQPTVRHRLGKMKAGASSTAASVVAGPSLASTTIRQTLRARPSRRFCNFPKAASKGTYRRRESISGGRLRDSSCCRGHSEPVGDLAYSTIAHCVEKIADRNVVAEGESSTSCLQLPFNPGLSRWSLGGFPQFTNCIGER